MLFFRLFLSVLSIVLSFGLLLSCGMKGSPLPPESSAEPAKESSVEKSEEQAKPLPAPAPKPKSKPKKKKKKTS